MMKKGNDFSYDFSTIKYENKNKKITLEIRSEITSSNLKFVCVGVNFLLDDNNEKIKMIWKKNDETVIQSSNEIQFNKIDFSQKPEELSLAFGKPLIKNYKYSGFEANYKFVIKPSNDYSTGGDFVRVSFGQRIPPRFNRNGFLECKMDGESTFCKIDGERIVLIYILKDMKKQLTYSFEIFGVLQSSEIIASDLINIATYKDNKIIEHVDIIEIPINDIIQIPLLTINYSVSHSYIRKTSDIYLHIIFPENLIKNQKFYLEFPPSYNLSLKQKPAISCNLGRLNDNSNTNHVKRCSILENRKIEISVKNFSSYKASFDNSAYRLKIIKFPTPIEKDSGLIFPIFWTTIKQANGLVKMYRTISGYQNNSNVQFIEKKYEKLIWSSQMIITYIGYFKKESQASLKIKQGNFNADMDFIINSIESSFLFHYPKILSVKIGFPELQIKFMSNFTGNPGLYYIPIY